MNSLIAREGYLLERAQYCYNADTYDHHVFSRYGFHGSLVEFMVKETEKLHAQMGRYNSLDDHPFFSTELPKPMFHPLQYPQVLHPCADLLNLNNKVWNMYFKNLLIEFDVSSKTGYYNGNHGSAAVCDTNCLQVYALSKRIHYGKFVAEVKFIESSDVYEAAIREQDRDKLMALLTYEAVEAATKKRVEAKAKAFGQEVRSMVEGDDGADPAYKIKPRLVANLYGDWIMPLTKEVQVEYLLRRSD
ncbi:hypothetical protein PVL29_001083 [Vitis rotundifolia]|uniref:chorismate mutase n=1 Tax=Vitis rotundifolia TaxID=103349 RepID=A0AA39E7V2_VITRO|nr:hypothetical protein PVL29_001083 [Vitis rotundifolia]